MKKIYFFLIFLLLLILKRDTAFAFAGEFTQNGVTVAGGSNGPGANQLDYPSKMTLDVAGNIYIADQLNNRVQKWAPGASSGITVAGGNGPGSAANQLYNPLGLSLDQAGNIYIADQPNNRIQKWAPGATAGVTVAGGNGYGAAANQLAFPNDVFVDAAENIFVADTYNSRIQKWAPGALTGVTVAGGTGEGPALNKLNNPNSLFVDVAGNIYISDAGNFRIQKWLAGAATGITVAGGNGQGGAANQLIPQGLFVDGAQNIYVGDGNNRVQKWAPGAVSGVTVAGGFGSGSAANQLYSPTSIFIDVNGNMFVDDRLNSRIQKFVMAISSGSPLKGITVAGGNGYGAAPNQLATPNGVFVDAAGNIFVADTYNGRIMKWAPGATTGSSVTGGVGQLNGPIDVFVDANANMYVAEPSTNRVLKFAPGSLTPVVVAGGHGPGSGADQLLAPTGVFVDVNGNIYVADNANHRIQKWAPGAIAGVTVAGGNGTGPAANQLGDPFDVFVDAAGNIYVADPVNQRIQKWSPGASAGTTVAGGNGLGNAANQINPFGVYVDVAGNIYVSDNQNARIQKFAPGASTGVTVAGGNGNGSSDIQLAAPVNISVDAAGNLYVADQANNRIQQFKNVALPLICPPGINITASSCNSKVTIKWQEPRDTFPTVISVAKGTNFALASIVYKGSYNGHGYYESTDRYSWNAAYLAAQAAGAHLVTITSAGENDFIFKHLNQRFNYAWIGLHSNGVPGGFEWVTGEPFGYANWYPGEPNNLFNIPNPTNPTTIFEPYVHINGWSDSLCRWNDNGNINASFIAEFDNLPNSFRQIAGPANGSEQSPGVYSICYERTNNVTGGKDTCCFNVTISCNNTAASDKSLTVMASPNPTSNYFRLSIATDQHETISMKITDITGRIIESRTAISASEAVEFGGHYKPGIYFAQVLQGSKKVIVKVIKQ